MTSIDLPWRNPVWWKIWDRRAKMSSVPPGGRQDFTPPVRRLRTAESERVDSLSELARALSKQRLSGTNDPADMERWRKANDDAPSPAPFVSAGEAARAVVDDLYEPNRPLMKRLEQALAKKPLDEIAAFARALTYGEMIEFAGSLFACAPVGGITRENLPAVIHRWATQEPERAKTPEKETSGPQHQEARASHRMEPRQTSRDAGAGISEGEGDR